MKNSIKISNKDDLEKLRNLTPGMDYVVYIKNDIDFEGNEFVPIDAGGCNLDIRGNGHKLSSLMISSTADYVGLFSKVENIKVSNLTMDNAHIYGNYYVGTIVGKCQDTAIFENCNIYSIVNGEIYVGALVGCSKQVWANNDEIFAIISAKDIAGGIVGMTDYFESSIPNNVDITFGQTTGKSIGNLWGYNSKDAELQVIKMIKESLSHLPVDCKEEEMSALKRTLNIKY